MKTLGEALREDNQELVHRWYETWRASSRPRPEISEAALKDHLPAQLKLIGEQLHDLNRAERTGQIWQVTERLDPELRVSQDVPIEEVVQEYALIVDVVRDWVEEQGLEVTFEEYSYFFRAMFELTAESVRRYVNYQAEQVRKARAHYLASVMHQLRTPLSALDMQVELLAENPQRPDAAVIGRLQRNARRLQALVGGILRLERYEPSEVPVHPEEVRPAQLVDDIVADHEAQAARKKLRFEAHVDRSLRMTLDPEMFLDALGNLVDNAIKYTSAGRVVIDAGEAPDGVLFCVRDTGPGLSPEQQRELFIHPLPGSAGGAGIGLQIAQHAARAQGGRIDVESTPGEGSVFSLWLPWVVAAKAGGGEGEE